MTPYMRAIRQDVLGDPEVMKLVEVPRPAPGATEVLVRVHAAGVNPVDWKVRRNGGFLRTPPFTVGWDVSGTVAELGPGSTRFEVGDEVYGMPRFPLPANGYSQYVTAPSRQFARKPAGVDHVTAAGLPLAGLTAWQALVDTAHVAPGQRVLVHAAAGGVGHLAVQVAKARGGYVFGTASGAKHDFVKECGADEVIDYTQQDFTEVARDVDVVLDTIGGEYAQRSLRTLRPGGILVSLVGLGEAKALREAAGALGVRAAILLVEPDQVGLAELANLVERGQLRVHVAATFPLEQAAQAHALGESNHTTGKIVLTVAGDADGDAAAPGGDGAHAS